MDVQTKPRNPEDAPAVLYPKVSRVWYLPGRVALSFQDAEGIYRVFPLVEYEIQVLDESKE